MNVIIVGGEKLVYFLSRVLISKGHFVTIINHDRQECLHLSMRLKATIVRGNGSDPAVLEDAGAHSADSLIAVTPHDQDNLVICQLAANKYRVPRLLALVNDPDNENVFRELGVPAISTTRIISGLIEQKSQLDNVVNLMPATEGKSIISEVVISGDSPVAGLVLKDISMPRDSLIAVIQRGDETLIPRGLTPIEKGDRCVVITLPVNHGEVIRLLTGEKGRS
ncbi:MAG TPA: TrkA family potassium uptake protein [Spirochaetes bacterium]|nr:TrkA family potassium uptake protein [Spirochaetota bacterium]